MGLTKCLIMNSFLFPTVLVLVLASPGSASQCRDDGSTPPDCQHWQDPEQPLYQPHQYNCSLFWQCTPDSRACLHECSPHSSSILGTRQSQTLHKVVRIAVMNPRSVYPSPGMGTGLGPASSSPGSPWRC